MGLRWRGLQGWEERSEDIREQLVLGCAFQWVQHEGLGEDTLGQMCSVQLCGEESSEEGFLEGGLGVSGGNHFKPDGQGPLAPVSFSGPLPSAVEQGQGQSNSP